MATVEELETVMKDQRFWSLPPERQANAVGKMLNEIYGGRYSGLAPDRQQQLVGSTINEARPKGVVESTVSLVPFVGPLAEQLVYNRNVKASPLTEKLVGPEASRQYGGLLQAGEDLVILGGAMAALYFAAPALLAGTAFEGASLLVNSVAREAAIGGLYEVGKLVTTPPGGVGEAVGRVAIGTVAGGVLGGGIEAGLAGIRTLRGRPEGLSEFAFDKALTAGKITEQRLTRDIRLELAGGDESLARHMSSEAIKDTKEQFLARVRSGDPNAITNEDIARMLRISADRKSDGAVELRQQANNLLREKQRLQDIHEEVQLGAVEQSARTTQRLQEQARTQQATELDSAYAEIQARSGQAELYRAQRTQEEELVSRRHNIERDAKQIQVQAQIDEAQRFAQDTRLERFQRVSVEAREAANTVIETQRAETARREAANEAIASVEQGRREAVRPTLTKSEQMLVDSLGDESLARNGFVGTEPVTLPMGMVDNNGAPVIVEQFRGQQAVLRGGKGIVSRTTLREPVSDGETTALAALLRKEAVGTTPSREDALSILRSRVTAEQAVRQADVHAQRPDFGVNTQAQVQEFNLRRGAAAQLLRSTNRELEPATLAAVDAVTPIAGKRTIASVDNLPLYEANNVAQSLAGSGFNNVKLSISPEGTVGVVFTRGDTEIDRRASNLYANYISRRGTVDPTTRTYSGLTTDEHEFIGRAFGLSDAQTKRYKLFVDQTLNDTVSRGIRVPADVETLGVRPIEEQVLTKARSAQPLRPDAIVSAEQMQRFERGDWLTMNVGGEQHLFQVAEMAWHEPTKQQRPMLRTPEGVDVGPVSQEQLRAAGARREITEAIGADPTNPLTWNSPARSLEAMLNPASRSKLLDVVPVNRSAIENAARGDGMRATSLSNGDMSITLNGMRLDFTGPSAVEDAARFVNAKRFLAEEKRKLIDGFGGEGCLR